MRRITTAAWAYLRSAPFTWLMSIGVLALFGLTWWDGGKVGVGDALTWGALSAPRVVAGEWSLVISFSFLHSDWDHVLGNLKVLLVIGLLLEPSIGTTRTALIYGLGILGAAVGTLAFGGPGCGSSGAIFALEGAFLASPLGRWKNRLLGAIAWLIAARHVLGMLDFTYDHPHVDDAAHLGGFIAGLCAGACFQEHWGVHRSWTRPHRITAAALASVGLLIAVAPDPRWVVLWNRNMAWVMEGQRDLDAVERYWKTIERLADPRLPTQAGCLWDAAQFRVHQGDSLKARQLLSPAAPAIREAEAYGLNGFLWARCEPADMRVAVKNWRKACALDSEMEDVNDAIARAILFQNDSTLGTPQEAREFATRAVRATAMRVPEHIQTLAWAHYKCGDIDAAFTWIRNAIAKTPKCAQLFTSQLAEMESARESPKMASRDGPGVPSLQAVAADRDGR